MKELLWSTQIRSKYRSGRYRSGRNFDTDESSVKAEFTASPQPSLRPVSNRLSQDNEVNL
jgi:hypothetical protein